MELFNSITFLSAGPGTFRLGFFLSELELDILGIFSSLSKLELELSDSGDDSFQLYDIRYYIDQSI